MRELEQKGKEADVRLVEARANYMNARSAKSLFSIEQVIDKTKVFVTDRMALYENDNHVYLKLRLSTDLISSDGWTVIIKNGGRYLQHSRPTVGILEFKLPMDYSNPAWDIGNKDHKWFSSNVSVFHEGLKLTLPYKTPI